MKIRFTLAAVAAAAGLASAQPVQVFQKIRPPVPYDGPAEPAKTDKPTEFKPAANTDPDPKSLEVPTDTQKKAQELTAKLGSKVYAEREQATKELGKMGRMALPALYEAIGSATEPEVAQRAEGLLPRAEAEDMKARVACFLADTEGKYTHNLPGWEKFKKVAGDDKSTRELFGEALKQPLTHNMLLAADKTAEEANAVLNQYVGKLMGNYGRWDGGGAVYQPKLADFVVGLFLEGQFTDKEVVIQPPNLQWFGGGQLFSVMTASNWSGTGMPQDVQNAIYSNNGKHKDAIRKLLLQWMDTRETAMGANQAYSYAQNMFNRAEDTKKRFKYAAKVLEAESGPNTSYMKINILTQFGQGQNGVGKEYLGSIAKCFDDSTLIWNWQNQNPPFDIQLRDYALAVALQLTDQKPEDYEMSRTSGYGSAKEKRWEQNAFYFKDDTPNKNPNFGGGRFPGKGGGIPVDPKDDKDKKDDTKKDDPKEKKVSQDDRRKIAFKKWDDWVKENVGIEEKDKADERTKKWEAWAKAPKKEPKKDEPKKDETKPGGKDEPKKEPTAEEQKKLEELKKEQKKLEEQKKEEVIRKEAETTVAPAVPKK